MDPESGFTRGACEDGRFHGPDTGTLADKMFKTSMNEHQQEDLARSMLIDKLWERSDNVEIEAKTAADIDHLHPDWVKGAHPHPKPFGSFQLPTFRLASDNFSNSEANLELIFIIGNGIRFFQD